MHQRIVTGRIADLTLFSLVEFGTRCDLVVVSGFDEPRPSTAAANTPWLGRFRVCAGRAVGDARLAA
jgi:hypothetical protein